MRTDSINIQKVLCYYLKYELKLPFVLGLCTQKLMIVSDADIQ
jgi:hypothetical protein